MAKEPHIPGSICGHCGEETGSENKKVAQMGFANILCFKCESMLLAELSDIARRFLTTSAEAIKKAKEVAKRKTS